MFEPYLSRWTLTPDGDPIATRAARLLPVTQDGRMAMLKLAVEEEERAGGMLMVWWDGNGAARVLAHEDGALLMERATGPSSLCDLARNGRDDEACAVLCATAATLHAPPARPFPELIPLTQWFLALGRVAAARGGLLSRCDIASRTLLATQREVMPLHGDLHHGNVLDFGARGWPSIPSASWASAASTSPTSSATPTCRWPQSPAASCAALRSSPRRHGWSASACCSGSSPGAACLRPSPWRTVMRRGPTCCG